MSKLPTRAELLETKLPTVDVVVPELGDDITVRVQQMSVNTRSIYLERIRQHQEDTLAYEDDQDLPVAERKGIQKPADLDKAILAIVYSLIDEEGARLFSEADMPLFNTWAANAVTRIYEAVIKLNEYNRFISEAVSTEKKG